MAFYSQPLSLLFVSSADVGCSLSISSPKFSYDLTKDSLCYISMYTHIHMYVDTSALKIRVNIICVLDCIRARVIIR